MDADIGVQTVKDGNRILRFVGLRLASVSSARAGAPRWSELTVYRLRNGEYLLEKVGRSTVCHRPECPRVTRAMPSWLEAREEGRVHRTPCPECQPLVGNAMDPHTRLEAQRYTVMSAPTLDGLHTLLTASRGGGGGGEAPLVTRLLLIARRAERSAPEAF